jgi:hypothetical protein
MYEMVSIKNELKPNNVVAAGFMGNKISSCVHPALYLYIHNGIKSLKIQGIQEAIKMIPKGLRK